MTLRLSILCLLQLASEALVLTGSGHVGRTQQPVQQRARSSARMALTPVNDQVLVELVKQPAQSEGGIFLPLDNNDDFEAEVLARNFGKKEVTLGTVLAVGPGALLPDGTRMVMPELAVGQQVICSPFGGEKVGLDTEGKEASGSPLYLFAAEDVWTKSDA